MFSRAQHQRIARLLCGMNAVFLKESNCCFAGGTCISMRLREFRESVDVDFLCSSRAGYRAVRSTVTSDSLGSLFSTPPRLLRDVRADRYGVRTVVDVDGTPVKFEVVLEGRIEIDCEQIPELPVPVLDRRDLYAEKLLANCDRRADRGVFGRDIIDLMMMCAAWGPIPDAALAKASSAYGVAPLVDLRRAAQALRDDPDWFRRCVETLAVTEEAERLVRAQLQQF